MKAGLEAIYGSVGAKVRYLREMLDITQEELAKRVGKTRGSIANFELGNERILLHDLETYAKALGTTPKNLVKGVWW